MASEQEVNVQAVRALCQCLSDKDADGVAAYLADDATWTVAGRPDRFEFGGKRDKDGSRELLKGFLGAFSDFEFTVDSTTAQDDRVAVRAFSRGTGPGGAKYQNNYLMLFRLKDGKVVEALEYFDAFEVLAFVEQLG